WEGAPRPLTKGTRTTRRLDRDLETIVMKALEKEPSRRYQSAAAFSEDIQRYLSNQPILARPPSAVYQFRKLVARHKGLFAFLGVRTAPPETPTPSAPSQPPGSPGPSPSRS